MNHDAPRQCVVLAIPFQGTHYSIVPTPAMAEESEAKRQRTGTMPADLKAKIQESLDILGEVVAYRKPHRSAGGPIQAHIRPAEDLVHEKSETLRQCM